MALGKKIKGFVTGDKESQEQAPASKYPGEVCALCGSKNCEKKWAGQFWHKKCMRTMRRSAKGMV